MPIPILIGTKRVPARGCFPLPFLIQRIHALEHVERCMTGIALVRGVVERRVPERHATASPIYLSMVPLRAMMALVRGVKKRFINVVSPCGLSL